METMKGKDGYAQTYRQLGFQEHHISKVREFIRIVPCELGVVLRRAFVMRSFLQFTLGNLLWVTFLLKCSFVVNRRNNNITQKSNQYF
jgi:hypothetical protein